MGFVGHNSLDGIEPAAGSVFRNAQSRPVAFQAITGRAGVRRNVQTIAVCLRSELAHRVAPMSSDVVAFFTATVAPCGT